jgi:DNA/RNA-binding domain of Phe-tRNA-synthetase-like protein
VPARLEFAMFNPVFRLNTPANLGLQAIAFSLHALDNQHYSSALKNSLTRLRGLFDIQHSLRQMEGFNALRVRMGRSPKRFPASPQALLDHYLRKGALRSIAPIVELYNQWSLNSGLSIGAHDLQRLHLPVSLTLTQGSEPFHALGSATSQVLPNGEYAYIDARGQVLCRMEYRQCAATALTPDSSTVLFIVQGHPGTEPEYLQQVARDLKADLMHCCASNLSRVA